MAALAAQEIRDVFDGKGDIELAKKSLHLLLSIIAGAVPNTPTPKNVEPPANSAALELIQQADNEMSVAAGKWCRLMELLRTSALPCWAANTQITPCVYCGSTEIMTKQGTVGMWCLRCQKPRTA
jgi:hypothetical protein